MRKQMKTAPGMTKATVVRTTMKAPFGGRNMAKRATSKRSGRGR